MNYEIKGDVRMIKGDDSLIEGHWNQKTYEDTLRRRHDYLGRAGLLQEAQGNRFIRLLRQWFWF